MLTSSFENQVSWSSARKRVRFSDFLRRQGFLKNYLVWWIKFWQQIMLTCRGESKWVLWTILAKNSVCCYTIHFKILCQWQVFTLSLWWTLSSRNYNILRHQSLIFCIQLTSCVCNNSVFQLLVLPFGQARSETLTRMRECECPDQSLQVQLKHVNTELKHIQF